MYLLVLFWALLALFLCVLRSDRFGCWYCISINQVRSGMRWAAAAAVPALLLAYVVMALCGYGALWDHFFPVWVSETATRAGEWFVDYILDNVLWGVAA